MSKVVISKLRGGSSVGSESDSSLSAYTKSQMIYIRNVLYRYSFLILKLSSLEVDLRFPRLYYGWDACHEIGNFRIFLKTDKNLIREKCSTY